MRSSIVATAEPFERCSTVIRFKSAFVEVHDLQLREEVPLLVQPEPLHKATLRCVCVEPGPEIEVYAVRRGPRHAARDALAEGKLRDEQAVGQRQPPEHLVDLDDPHSVQLLAYLVFRGFP